MKKVILVIFTAALGSFVLAKDHSGDYRMGTLSKLTVKSGWVDTTTCSGDPGNVHCSGGVYNDYTDVYLFTYDDGTAVVIHHALGRPDTVKALNLEANSIVRVLYRTERKHGLVSVDYVVIPAADNPKREGWYYLDGHFKKPSPDAKKPVPPTDQSNLKAMCDSDKLSPELKTQYCK